MDANQQVHSGTIGFIGFGEAGSAFVEGWRRGGPHIIRAYDVKTDSADAGVRAAKLADYEKWGVTGGVNAGDALTDCGVVISVVTADRALEAATAAAEVIRPGTFYLDCNSCAPGTKRISAAVIDGAGGRYVDVAVMAPVHPKLHRVPMLIGGPHATAAMAFFEAMGMDARAVSDEVGAASSIKMIRSVMVKGLEALTLECLLAARKAGVEEPVIASLEQSYPGMGWRDKCAYSLERVMTHGIRRASEMRAVAETVDDLALFNGMATATAEWQQRIGDLKIKCEGESYTERVDEILAALKKSGL